MTLRIITLFLGLSVCLAESSQAQKTTALKDGFTLTGKIQNATGMVYLEEMTSPSTFARRDSAIIGKDGSFTFQGQVKQPTLFRLLFDKNQAMLVPVENRTITVGGDLTDLTGTAFSKGSRESEALQDMRKIRNRTQAHTKRLNERYTRNQTNPDSVRAIINQFNRLAAQEIKELKTFVLKNPASIVGVYTTLAVIDPAAHLSFVDTMLAVYQQRLPASPYTRMLADRANLLRQTAEGSMAPDINLSDPDGNPVPLSSLRGKYVLIDFWASWCGPCRKENPNMVRLYNEYKDLSFEIYAVSLDKEREKWIKAIADDNLTWTHVSDLKFWQSEAAKLYNISSIPATVLIDPTGKIIAKNLRGQALEEKIASLLKQP